MAQSYGSRKWIAGLPKRERGSQYSAHPPFSKSDNPFPLRLRHESAVSFFQHHLSAEGLSDEPAKHHAFFHSLRSAVRLHACCPSPAASPRHLSSLGLRHPAAQSTHRQAYAGVTSKWQSIPSTADCAEPDQRPSPASSAKRRNSLPLRRC